MRGHFKPFLPTSFKFTCLHENKYLFYPTLSNGPITKLHLLGLNIQFKTHGFVLYFQTYDPANPVHSWYNCRTKSKSKLFIGKYHNKKYLLECLYEHYLIT